jgi:D-alanyl-D-alanine carboxypeptidase/D-alanyl-D-alanine-endopeptidase (penicillin-binding protein 4)
VALKHRAVIMMRTGVPIALLAAFMGLQAAATPPGQAEGDAPVATAPAAPAGVPDAYASALRSDLEEMIRRPRWSGDRWSVLVVSLDRGDTLFAHGAHESLAPASNMKLFTTAAALYYLGPDFRYNTFLMSTGPINNGVLEGDLVVYGTGDPTFSDRFGNKLRVFQAFADTLQALGVREVRGDIVGDGSYFEGSGAGEGWQQSYMNASYAASAGALSFAENIAYLQIAPAEQAGWRPEVKLMPGGEGIALVNQATTSARSGRIDASRIAYDGPVVVRGQIGRNAAPVLRAVPISDPARYAAAVFREVLQKRDIVVTGGVRAAVTEAESPVTGRSVFAPALDSQEPVRVLAVHTSGPLMQILEIINKKSHNLMAEQVLRTVGRVAVGEGSVEGGRRAIQHMLEREGHSPNAVTLYDGSGLSVLNRASAAGIVDLLALMAESPMWQPYWETLPEAGASDGLRRMYRTDAERNLRAKTGTIDNVSALSGYVRAANGERLAFSIISNSVPSTFTAKRVEDAIGARLAEFTRPVASGTATTPATTPVDTQPTTATPPQSTEPAAAVAAPAPAPAKTAAAATRTHKIKSGDTLSEIAQEYGITVSALQKANPGLNARRLRLGQTVKIPK